MSRYKLAKLLHNQRFFNKLLTGTSPSIRDPFSRGFLNKVKCSSAKLSGSKLAEFITGNISFQTKTRAIARGDSDTLQGER